MNILTLIVVAGFGISFLFSAVVLAACSISSRGRQDEYYEEVYDYSESYGLESSWATEA
ncbi:MAG: hypothetical protein AAF490_18635 [Chloroflexota bacterium]